jgi:hypothetical protein
MKTENTTFVFISVYHIFPSPSKIFVFLTPLWTRIATVNNHFTVNTSCPEEVITVEPRYNDICLYDTSSIASDILWYQLIRHC